MTTDQPSVPQFGLTDLERAVMKWRDAVDVVYCPPEGKALVPATDAECLALNEAAKELMTLARRLPGNGLEQPTA